MTRLENRDDVIDLPECIVWPGNDHGDDAARWWVASDPETSTFCRIDECFGVSIGLKETP